MDVGEPTLALAMLKSHQLRTGLLSRVRAVEAVTRLDPETGERLAPGQEYGMDRAIRRSAEMYAKLAEDVY